MFLSRVCGVVLNRTIKNCKIEHFQCLIAVNSHLMSHSMSSTPSDHKQNFVFHIHAFENVKKKNRESYLDMIRIFINRDNIYRRGHVEFIYSALKNMKSFSVHKDVDVYKALINVLPKGKFIPTNMFQIEFMHYPKQQQCIIDLLEQMEDNGVMPDYEMEDLLSNIFGNKSFPLRKYWRMMYWMPKFKNTSPWPLPNPLPDNTLELAKCAIQRISSVDVQSQITIYQSKEIKDSIDDTWIVSAQSPSQKKILKHHDVKEPLYVEGGYRVWLKDCQVNYFILRKKSESPDLSSKDLDDISDIKIPLFNIKPPTKKYLEIESSIHEQEDGVILALCATGTSSKDSLLSWIRHLENDGNSALADAFVVFTLRTGTREIVTIINSKATKQLETK